MSKTISKNKTILKILSAILLLLSVLLPMFFCNLQVKADEVSRVSFLSYSREANGNYAYESMSGTEYKSDIDAFFQWKFPARSIRSKAMEEGFDDKYGGNRSKNKSYPAEESTENGVPVLYRNFKPSNDSTYTSGVWAIFTGKIYANLFNFESNIILNMGSYGWANVYKDAASDLKKDVSTQSKWVASSSYDNFLSQKDESGLGASGARNGFFLDNKTQNGYGIGGNISKKNSGDYFYNTTRLTYLKGYPYAYWPVSEVSYGTSAASDYSWSLSNNGDSRKSWWVWASSDKEKRVQHGSYGHYLNMKLGKTGYGSTVVHPKVQGNYVLVSSGNSHFYKNGKSESVPIAYLTGVTVYGGSSTPKPGASAQTMGINEYKNYSGYMLSIPDTIKGPDGKTDYKVVVANDAFKNDKLKIGNNTYYSKDRNFLKLTGVYFNSFSNMGISYKSINGFNYIQQRNINDNYIFATGRASGISFSDPEGFKDYLSAGPSAAAKEENHPEMVSTVIGTSSFEGCKSLTYLVLPSDIQKIPKNAFSGTNIEYLNLPASVRTLSYNSFSSISNLSCINFAYDTSIANKVALQYFCSDAVNNGMSPYTPFNNCQNVTMLTMCGKREFVSKNTVTSKRVHFGVSNNILYGYQPGISNAPYRIAYAAPHLMCVDFSSNSWTTNNVRGYGGASGETDTPTYKNTWFTQFISEYANSNTVTEVTTRQWTASQKPYDRVDIYYPSYNFSGKFLRKRVWAYHDQRSPSFSIEDYNNSTKDKNGFLLGESTYIPTTGSKFISLINENANTNGDGGFSTYMSMKYTYPEIAIYRSQGRKHSLDIIVPKTVTEIDANAFLSTSFVRNVYLPSSLKMLGSRNFYYPDDKQYIGLTQTLAGIYYYDSSKSVNENTSTHAYDTTEFLNHNYTGNSSNHKDYLRVFPTRMSASQVENNVFSEFKDSATVGNENSTPLRHLSLSLGMAVDVYDEVINSNAKVDGNRHNEIGKLTYVNSNGTTKDFYTFFSDYVKTSYGNDKISSGLGNNDEKGVKIHDRSDAFLDTVIRDLVANYYHKAFNYGLKNEQGEPPAEYYTDQSFSDIVKTSIAAIRKNKSNVAGGNKSYGDAFDKANPNTKETIGFLGGKNKNKAGLYASGEWIDAANTQALLEVDASSVSPIAPLARSYYFVVDSSGSMCGYMPTTDSSDPGYYARANDQLAGSSAFTKNLVVWSFVKTYTDYLIDNQDTSNLSIIKDANGKIAQSSYLGVRAFSDYFVKHSDKYSSLNGDTNDFKAGTDRFEWFWDQVCSAFSRMYPTPAENVSAPNAINTGKGWLINLNPTSKKGTDPKSDLKKLISTYIRFACSTTPGDSYYMNIDKAVNTLTATPNNSFQSNGKTYLRTIPCALDGVTKLNPAIIVAGDGMYTDEDKNGNSLDRDYWKKLSSEKTADGNYKSGTWKSKGVNLYGLYMGDKNASASGFNAIKNMCPDGVFQINDASNVTNAIAGLTSELNGNYTVDVPINTKDFVVRASNIWISGGGAVCPYPSVPSSLLYTPTDTQNIDYLLNDSALLSSVSSGGAIDKYVSKTSEVGSQNSAGFTNYRFNFGLKSNKNRVNRIFFLLELKDGNKTNVQKLKNIPLCENVSYSSPFVFASNTDTTNSFSINGLSINRTMFSLTKKGQSLSSGNDQVLSGAQFVFRNGNDANDNIKFVPLVGDDSIAFRADDGHYELTYVRHTNTLAENPKQTYEWMSKKDAYEILNSPDEENVVIYNNDGISALRKDNQDSPIIYYPTYYVADSASETAATPGEGHGSNADEWYKWLGDKHGVVITDGGSHFEMKSVDTLTTNSNGKIYGFGYFGDQQYNSTSGAFAAHETVAPAGYELKPGPNAYIVASSDPSYALNKNIKTSVDVTDPLNKNSFKLYKYIDVTSTGLESLTGNTAELKKLLSGLSFKFSNFKNVNESNIVSGNATLSFGSNGAHTVSLPSGFSGDNFSVTVNDPAIVSYGSSKYVQYSFDIKTHAYFFDVKEEFSGNASKVFDSSKTKYLTTNDPTNLTSYIGRNSIIGTDIVNQYGPTRNIRISAADKNYIAFLNVLKTKSINISKCLISTEDTVHNNSKYMGTTYLVSGNTISGIPLSRTLTIGRNNASTTYSYKNIVGYAMTKVPLGTYSVEETLPSGSASSFGPIKSAIGTVNSSNNVSTFGFERLKKVFGIPNTSNETGLPELTVSNSQNISLSANDTNDAVVYFKNTYVANVIINKSSFDLKISGITFKLKDKATGEEYTAVTNSLGVANFSNIPILDVNSSGNTISRKYDITEDTDHNIYSPKFSAVDASSALGTGACSVNANGTDFCWTVSSINSLRSPLKLVVNCNNNAVVGSIMIKKTVESNSLSDEEKADLATKVKFNVYADGQLVKFAKNGNGKYGYKATGTVTTLSVNTENANLLLVDLPVNNALGQKISYTVKETDASSAEFSSTKYRVGNTGSFTTTCPSFNLNVGSSVNVNVKNEKSPGTLTIKKMNANNLSQSIYDPEIRFTVTKQGSSSPIKFVRISDGVYEYSETGSVTELALKDNSTPETVAQKLPAGKYVVTETKYNQTKYVQVVKSANVTLSDSSPSATAIITNKLKEKTIYIDKFAEDILTDEKVPNLKNISFKISGTDDDGNSVVKDIVIQDNNYSISSYSWQNKSYKGATIPVSVPYGTYNVKEESFNNYSSVPWRQPIYNRTTPGFYSAFLAGATSENFTINESSENTRVTFYNKVKTSELTIYKVVAGDAAYMNNESFARTMAASTYMQVSFTKNDYSQTINTKQISDSSAWTLVNTALPKTGTTTIGKIFKTTVNVPIGVDVVVKELQKSGQKNYACGKVYAKISDNISNAGLNSWNSPSSSNGYSYTLKSSGWTNLTSSVNKQVSLSTEERSVIFVNTVPQYRVRIAKTDDSITSIANESSSNQTVKDAMKSILVKKLAGVSVTINVPSPVSGGSKFTEIVEFDSASSVDAKSNGNGTYTYYLYKDVLVPYPALSGMTVTEAIPSTNKYYYGNVPSSFYKSGSSAVSVDFSSNGAKGLSREIGPNGLLQYSFVSFKNETNKKDVSIAKAIRMISDEDTLKQQLSGNNKVLIEIKNVDLGDKVVATLNTDDLELWGSDSIIDDDNSLVACLTRTIKLEPGTYSISETFNSGIFENASTASSYPKVQKGGENAPWISLNNNQGNAKFSVGSSNVQVSLLNNRKEGEITIKKVSPQAHKDIVPADQVQYLKNLYSSLCFDIYDENDALIKTIDVSKSNLTASAGGLRSNYIVASWKTSVPAGKYYVVENYRYGIPNKDKIFGTLSSSAKYVVGNDADTKLSSYTDSAQTGFSNGNKTSLFDVVNGVANNVVFANSASNVSVTLVKTSPSLVGLSEEEVRGRLNGLKFSINTGNSTPTIVEIDDNWSFKNVTISVNGRSLVVPVMYSTVSLPYAKKYTLSEPNAVAMNFDENFTADSYSYGTAFNPNSASLANTVGSEYAFAANPSTNASMFGTTYEFSATVNKGRCVVIANRGKSFNLQLRKYADAILNKNAANARTTFDGVTFKLTSIDGFYSETFSITSSDTTWKKAHQSTKYVYKTLASLQDRMYEIEETKTNNNFDVNLARHNNPSDFDDSFSILGSKYRFNLGEAIEKNGYVGFKNTAYTKTLTMYKAVYWDNNGPSNTSTRIPVVGEDALRVLLNRTSFNVSKKGSSKSMVVDVDDNWTYFQSSYAENLGGQTVYQNYGILKCTVDISELSVSAGDTINITEAAYGDYTTPAYSFTTLTNLSNFFFGSDSWQNTGCSIDVTVPEKASNNNSQNATAAFLNEIKSGPAYVHKTAEDFHKEHLYSYLDSPSDEDITAYINDRLSGLNIRIKNTWLATSRYITLSPKDGYCEPLRSFDNQNSNNTHRCTFSYRVPGYGNMSSLSGRYGRPYGNDSYYFKEYYNSRVPYGSYTVEEYATRSTSKVAKNYKIDNEHVFWSTDYCAPEYADEQGASIKNVSVPAQVSMTTGGQMHSMLGTFYNSNDSKLVIRKTLDDINGLDWASMTDETKEALFRKYVDGVEFSVSPALWPRNSYIESSDVSKSEFTVRIDDTWTYDGTSNPPVIYKEFTVPNTVYTVEEKGVNQYLDITAVKNSVVLNSDTVQPASNSTYYNGRSADIRVMDGGYNIVTFKNTVLSHDIRIYKGAINISTATNGAKAYEMLTGTKFSVTSPDYGFALPEIAFSNNWATKVNGARALQFFESPSISVPKGIPVTVKETACNTSYYQLDKVSALAISSNNSDDISRDMYYLRNNNSIKKTEVILRDNQYAAAFMNDSLKEVTIYKFIYGTYSSDQLHELLDDTQITLVNEQNSQLRRTYEIDDTWTFGTGILSGKPYSCFSKKISIPIGSWDVREYDAAWFDITKAKFGVDTTSMVTGQIGADSDGQYSHRSLNLMSSSSIYVLNYPLSGKIRLYKTTSSGAHCTNKDDLLKGISDVSFNISGTANDNQYTIPVDNTWNFDTDNGFAYLYKDVDVCYDTYSVSESYPTDIYVDSFAFNNKSYFVNVDKANSIAGKIVSNIVVSPSSNGSAYFYNMLDTTSIKLSKTILGEFTKEKALELLDGTRFEISYGPSNEFSEIFTINKNAPDSWTCNVIEVGGKKYTKLETTVKIAGGENYEYGEFAYQNVKVKEFANSNFESAQIGVSLVDNASAIGATSYSKELALNNIVYGNDISTAYFHNPYTTKEIRIYKLASNLFGDFATEENAHLYLDGISFDLHNKLTGKTYNVTINNTWSFSTESITSRRYCLLYKTVKVPMGEYTITEKLGTNKNYLANKIYFAKNSNEILSTSRSLWSSSNNTINMFNGDKNAFFYNTSNNVSIMLHKVVKDVSSVDEVKSMLSHSSVVVTDAYDITNTHMLPFNSDDWTFTYDAVHSAVVADATISVPASIYYVNESINSSDFKTYFDPAQVYFSNTLEGVLASTTPSPNGSYTIAVQGTTTSLNNVFIRNTIRTVDINLVKYLPQASPEGLDRQNLNSILRGLSFNFNNLADKKQYSFNVNSDWDIEVVEEKVFLTKVCSIPAGKYNVSETLNSYFFSCKFFYNGSKNLSQILHTGAVYAVSPTGIDITKNNCMVGFENQSYRSKIDIVKVMYDKGLTIDSFKSAVAGTKFHISGTSYLGNIISQDISIDNSSSWSYSGPVQKGENTFFAATFATEQLPGNYSISEIIENGNIGTLGVLDPDNVRVLAGDYDVSTGNNGTSALFRNPSQAKKGNSANISIFQHTSSFSQQVYYCNFVNTMKQRKVLLYKGAEGFASSMSKAQMIEEMSGVSFHISGQSRYTGNINVSVPIDSTWEKDVLTNALFKEIYLPESTDAGYVASETIDNASAKKAVWNTNESRYSPQRSNFGTTMERAKKDALVNGKNTDTLVVTNQDNNNKFYFFNRFRKAPDYRIDILDIAPYNTANKNIDMNIRVSNLSQESSIANMPIRLFIYLPDGWREIVINEEAKKTVTVGAGSYADISYKNLSNLTDGNVISSKITISPDGKYDPIKNTAGKYIVRAEVNLENAKNGFELLNDSAENHQPSWTNKYKNAWDNNADYHILTSKDWIASSVGLNKNADNEYALNSGSFNTINPTFAYVSGVFTTKKYQNGSHSEQINVNKVFEKSNVSYADAERHVLDNSDAYVEFYLGTKNTPGGDFSYVMLKPEGSDSDGKLYLKDLDITTADGDSIYDSEGRRILFNKGVYKMNNVVLPIPNLTDAELSMPHQIKMAIRGGVAANSPAKDEVSYYNNETIQNVKIVRDIRLVVEKILPNSAYYEDTDVITTYRVINNGSVDFTGTDDFVLDFEVREKLDNGTLSAPISGLLISPHSASKNIVVPANSINYYYWKWHVPKGYVGKKLVCTARIAGTRAHENYFYNGEHKDGAGLYDEDTLTKIVQEIPISHTDDTDYSKSAKEALADMKTNDVKTNRDLVTVFVKDVYSQWERIALEQGNTGSLNGSDYSDFSDAIHDYYYLNKGLKRNSSGDADDPDAFVDESRNTDSDNYFYQNKSKWQEWTYDNSTHEFKKTTYIAYLNNNGAVKIDPSVGNMVTTENAAKFKSGYGFGLYAYAGLGYDLYDDSNTDNVVKQPEKSMYTNTQVASAFFPENRFDGSDSKYESLFTSDNPDTEKWRQKASKDHTFRIRNKTENDTDNSMETNEYNGKNIHFSPIWYPDGYYPVAVEFTQCWTPAGVISLQTVNTSLIVNGSIYDDWYNKSR